MSGKVDNIDTTGAFTAIGFSILGILWLAVTVSTALLGLLLLVLFRRPFETAATTERTDTGKSIGLGLATAIGLPIVAIVAVTTIVGLPFGLGILGAHGLLWSLGYVISAMCLGRTMIKAPRSAFGAFFAGWGILRLAALIPGLGALVWLGASVIGLGALVLAGFRGSRTGGSADSQSAPPVPTPKPVPTPVAVPVAKPAAASTGTAEKAAPVKKAPAKKAKPGADGG